MFEIYIYEELEKMREYYDTIKKSEFRPGNSILCCIWSHRHKTTPSGNIYCHSRSRLCADGNTQKFGLDYNETYGPVVMRSTKRTQFILGEL